MGTYKTHQFVQGFFSYCNPITGKLTRYFFDNYTTEVIDLCEIFELQCNEQTASLRYSNIKEETPGEFKRELNLSQVNKGFEKALLEVLWINRNEAVVVSRYSATKVLDVELLTITDKFHTQSLSYTPFKNSSFIIQDDSIPLNWTGMSKYVNGRKLYFVYSYSKVTISPGEVMSNIFEDFINTNFTHYDNDPNLAVLEVELR